MLKNIIYFEFSAVIIFIIFFIRIDKTNLLYFCKSILFLSLPLYNQLAKINRMEFWFVVVVDIIR